MCPGGLVASLSDGRVFGKDMTETHCLYRWEPTEKLTPETQNTFLGW